MTDDKQRATQRFHHLVWPCRAEVLRAARILCGSEAEADDLAQETLIKAFRAMGSFKDGTSIHAWLMTILRRTRIDRLRAAASAESNISLQALEASAGEPAAPDTCDVAAGESDWKNPEEMLNRFSDQEIIDALQHLPESIRMTLLLVDVERMSQQEAAEVLQVPIGTVKSRLHRGHAMLREALLPLARDRRLVRD